MSATFFAGIVLLSLGVAALPVEKMVRRESSQLGASGVFVEVKTNEDKAMTMTNRCDDDYVLSITHDGVCPEGSSIINDTADCSAAAELAGLQHTYVEIENAAYRYDRPAGCFMEPCPEAQAVGQVFETAMLNRVVSGTPSTAHAAMGPCYRWNPRDQQSDPINASDIKQGLTVCKRPRLKYGTINETTDEAGNTIKKTDCGAGYSPVKEEALCHEDGPCMGLRDNGNFDVNVANANEYDEHPLFCSLDEHPNGRTDERTVSFNKELSGEPDLPSNPVGAPICNVSTIVWFDRDGKFTPLIGCPRNNHSECLDMEDIAVEGNKRTMY